jgi:hypothetical protein
MWVSLSIRALHMLLSGIYEFREINAGKKNKWLEPISR